MCNDVVYEAIRLKLSLKKASELEEKLFFNLNRCYGNMHPPDFDKK